MAERKAGHLKSGEEASPALDARRIVGTLNRHGVRFVVIGAFAAIARGAPIPTTRDIDFTPDSDHENLVRLSAALRDLGARIRGRLPGLIRSRGRTDDR